jgi:hypothetical protein
MVQGFVPDRSYASVYVPTWHDDEPKKSFWSRTKEPDSDGLPIGAFRCQECGFLEFYADARFAAQ